MVVEGGDLFLLSQAVKGIRNASDGSSCGLSRRSRAGTRQHSLQPTRIPRNLHSDEDVCMNIVSVLFVSCLESHIAGESCLGTMLCMEMLATQYDYLAGIDFHQGWSQAVCPRPLVRILRLDLPLSSRSRCSGSAIFGDTVRQCLIHHSLICFR